MVEFDKKVTQRNRTAVPDLGGVAGLRNFRDQPVVGKLILLAPCLSEFVRAALHAPLYGRNRSRV